MNRRRLFLGAAAVALAITVGTGAAAAASTTVGQLFTPNLSSCAAGLTLLQTGVGDGNSYTVPADGVITSWSFQTNTAIVPGLKLKVGRAAGGDNYTIVGDSAAGLQAASSVNTYPAQIPVRANDLIGIFEDGGGCLSTTAASDTRELAAGDIPPGGTATEFSPGSSSRFPVAAKVEPDADGDGFGDETQDQCPTDPGTHAACRADLSVSESASSPIVTLGDLVTFTVTVKNNSAVNTSRSVSVSDPLSSGLTLVAARGDGCAGGTCTLDIAKGASAVLTFVARAASTGVQSGTAIAGSQTLDPNFANNAATAITTVLAPFGGLELRSQTVTVTNGKVQLIVACPVRSLGTCVGTDTLTTARKVVVPKPVGAMAKKAKILTLGKRRLSIAAGKTSKVAIKLNKTALKLLAKKHTLKATQTIVAHDSRNKAKTSTGSVKLRAGTTKRKNH
jgi:uncharacterized repeat protein (TIGR01451 family)